MSLFRRYIKHPLEDSKCELNIDVQNPVINSLSCNHQIIKEYLQLHRLSLDYILNWSCPICLESFSSAGISMCIPFKCSHPICFSCLKAWCETLKKKRYDSRGLQNISCCLCRRKSNDFWYKSFKVYTLTTNYQNTVITIVFPSQLDHRYPLGIDNQ